MAGNGSLLFTDPVLACADLVGRTGARSWELGYLHDGVPMEEAGWWCSAVYKGHKVIVMDQAHPVLAAMSLATRLLTGAKCRCGRLIVLSPVGAIAYDPALMADGSTWTAEQAMAAGQCLWRLDGRRWEPSCPEPTRPKPSRNHRRKGRRH
jgi:hypothetical protein